MHKAVTYGKRTYGEEIGMREGTQLTAWPLNLVMNGGGMGDFLCYTAATTWLAKNAPWVHGRIFCPKYLVPMMREIHQEFSNWAVWASEDFFEHAEPGTPMIGPNIIVNGTDTSKQLLNVLGAHPVDVGFAYYAHTCPAPPDGLLPIVDMQRSRLMPKVKNLKQPYAVVTTGHTTKSRTVTGRHLNPIIRNIVSRGWMPVFLGKTDLLLDGKKTTNFSDDVAYELGLDLRDQTSVKEAACIMQHAEVTLGLDNGLLHLAALMKDSRLIFGHNIASVEHRAPRRNNGRTINLSVSNDDLKCIGCQSKLKQIAMHFFSECLYGDVRCVELLFGNDGAKWIEAIDSIVSPI